MNRRNGITKVGILVGLLIAIAVIVGVLVVVKLDVTGRSGSGLGKEYVYDVSKYAKIDPTLIIYEGSKENIITGFEESRAIAVGADGEIYIAGDNSVSIINGKTIKFADEPRCLAVTGDGKIYVGLKEHIEVYDINGERSARWKSLGEKAVLTSIAVWEKNVFVADAGNRVVVRYDTAGNVINFIGRKDKDRNVPGFVIPSAYFDLAVSKDGLLRVANPGRQRIEAYTFDGDFEFSWGHSSVSVEGFCGCCNPVNFTILDDGGFVTSEKGLTRVKLYDSDGGFMGVVAGPEQFGGDVPWSVCNFPSECAKGGFDVAADKAGRVYVLDTIKNIVRVFTKKEKVL